MSLDQEYQTAKRQLADFEKRIKELESDNRQTKQLLRFILELQKEQALQHDRVYGWLAALFDTLSGDAAVGEKLKAHPFYDQGSLPAVRRHDVLAPNIDVLIGQLK